jgi:hypothetical protein
MCTKRWTNPWTTPRSWGEPGPLLWTSWGRRKRLKLPRHRGLRARSGGTRHCPTPPGTGADPEETSGRRTSRAPEIPRRGGDSRTRERRKTALPARLSRTVVGPAGQGTDSSDAGSAGPARPLHLIHGGASHHSARVSSGEPAATRAVSLVSLVSPAARCAAASVQAAEEPRLLRVFTACSQPRRVLRCHDRRHGPHSPRPVQSDRLDVGRRNWSWACCAPLSSRLRR